MEAVPTFSSSLSTNTVTLELQAYIDEAVTALPLAHRRPPTKGGIVESPSSGYVRLQDWSFTCGFALAIESANAEKTVFRCTHHQKKTRNIRKTKEANRQQVETHTRDKASQLS
jgi:hypothetical protein